MTRTLRVLIIEDQDDDVALIRRVLERGGFALEVVHVQDLVQLRLALETQTFQVVVSDFSLPQFDARAALALVRKLAPELPFIVVSGTVGEEVAVDAMRAGAADYISKSNLLRLVPVVERELNEAAGHAARLAERREAAAALRRSEQNFRALLDQLPMGVLVANEGQMVYANAAWLRYVGCDELSELVPLWPREVIDPADLPALEARLLPDEGKALPPLVSRLRSRTGQITVVQSTSLSLEFDGERATLMVSRDITAERDLQRRLMFADRMVSVGTLAAGVAHEINNPLAYIQGNLDFAALLLTGSDPSRLHEPARRKDLEDALREASEGTARVRQIVRDLKSLSRPDDEAVGPINVQRVLDSAVQMTNNELRHRARVVKEYGKLPLVLANEGRIGQVFINLLLNAAQAMEGGASANQLTVSTWTDERGRAVVSVRDTGVGMTPEIQARIFDPFFTSKPIGVGTGLGLAICHGIVSQMKGEIIVESAEGKGSEFRLVLQGLPDDAVVPPPKEGKLAPPALPPPPQPEATAPVLRRGRVLVIDDEPRIGKTLRRLLDNEHDVEVLDSGRAAIERIRSGARFEVILCDLMMPDASGMVVHQEISALAADQAARMIFLTGGAFTPLAQEFLARVDNTRVEKPFSPAELRALIRSRIQ